MEEQSFGIREAFKREPEQTNSLIKLVLGGGLVVAVFSVVAAVVLGSVMVLPVALVLSLIYSTAVVVTTARLTFSGAARRYMESAMQGRAAAQVGQPASPTAPIVEQASFNQAYFMLRLHEEVAGARRDGREMTVLALEATMPGIEMGPQAAEKVAKEIAEIASNHNKTISHTLSVSGSEYVMSLPHTSRAESKSFVSHVVQSLGNYWCHFGTATYPADGTSAEGLVRFARESVEESREGKNNSKSHAVA